MKACDGQPASKSFYKIINGFSLAALQTGSRIRRAMAMSCPFLHMLHFNFTLAGQFSSKTPTCRQYTPSPKFKCTTLTELCSFIKLKQCQCPMCQGHMVKIKIRLSFGCRKETTHYLLIHINTVLCKTLKPPRLTLYFAVKKPNFLVLFYNGLE